MREEEKAVVGVCAFGIELQREVLLTPTETFQSKTENGRNNRTKIFGLNLKQVFTIES